MDVRLARPTDAPLALALTLDERAHIVKSPDWPAARPAIRTVIRSIVPVALSGRTWIARDGDSVALLEAEPRKYVIGWDINRLAVRGDHTLVVGPVVEAATRHLQSRGVPRLFARCREDMHGELKAIGFHALAREHVLLGRATGSADADTLPVDSRYRMPQDAWPLHQLENQITPPLVRQLEGMTSLDWSRGAKGLREIVVERDGAMAGWIGWGGHMLSGAQQVGLLVQPGDADLASALLQHVLDQAPPGTRLIARVRDYQPETLRAFREAGFEAVAEEILMVRHARVELVRRELARVRVARVPGIQAFPIRVGITGPGAADNGILARPQKEDRP